MPNHAAQLAPIKTQRPRHSTSEPATAATSSVQKSPSPQINKDLSLSTLTAVVDPSEATLKVVAGTQGLAEILERLLPPKIEVIRHKLFLTINEAAEYTGLPRSAVLRLVRANQLPAAKLGGWRIKRTYLDRLELRHLRRLSRSSPNRS